MAHSRNNRLLLRVLLLRLTRPHFRKRSNQLDLRVDEPAASLSAPNTSELNGTSRPIPAYQGYAIASGSVATRKKRLGREAAPMGSFRNQLRQGFPRLGRAPLVTVINLIKVGSGIEVGRGAWRERVEVFVVAGSLKKKKMERIERQTVGI